MAYQTFCSQALCDKEDKCKFFSFAKDVCRRFTGDLNSCTPLLDGDTHKTYQKLRTSGSRRGRDRRAEDKVELVDYDYYAEYAEIRGVDVALKKEVLHKLKLPRAC